MVRTISGRGKSGELDTASITYRFGLPWQLAARADYFFSTMSSSIQGQKLPGFFVVAAFLIIVTLMILRLIFELQRGGSWPLLSISGKVVDEPGAPAHP
jgi:hypothetical protein